MGAFTSFFSDAAVELLKAVENGDLDAVKKCFGSENDIAFCSNVDINCLVKHADGNQRTFLMIASLKGELEIVRHLIKRGAEVDKADNFGVTALHLAAQNGQVAVVESLLRHKANKEKATNDGATPLFSAAHNGHLEVVRVFARSRSRQRQGYERWHYSTLRRSSERQARSGPVPCGGLWTRLPRMPLATLPHSISQLS